MDELRWLLLILGLLVIAGVYGWGRWQERRRRRTQRREPVPGDAAGDPLLDDDPVAPESLRGALEELDHLIAEERSSVRPGPSGSQPSSRQRPAGPARSAAPPAPEPTPEPRREPAPPPQPPRAPEPPPEPARPAPEPVPAPEPPPRQAAPPREPPQPAADDAEPPPSEVGEERIIVLHVAAPDGYRYGGRDLVRALEAAGLRHGEHDIFHRVLDSRQGPVSLFSAASMVEPGTFDLERLDQMETPGVALFMQLPGPFDGLTGFEQMLETARTLARDLHAQVLDSRRCELTRQTLEHIRDDLLEYRRLAHLAARRAH